MPEWPGLITSPDESFFRGAGVYYQFHWQEGVGSHHEEGRAWAWDWIGWI